MQRVEQPVDLGEGLALLSEVPLLPDDGCGDERPGADGHTRSRRSSCHGAVHDRLEVPLVEEPVAPLLEDLLDALFHALRLRVDERALVDTLSPGYVLRRLEQLVPGEVPGLPTRTSTERAET